MSDPLFGARSKIARAKRHIDDLQRQVTSFFDQHFRIVLKEYADTGERSIFVEANGTIPETFSLLIGDAVHNLRSALDHAIWEFVAPHSPSNTERIQFPFTRNPNSLVSTIRDRQVHLAGPEVVRIITESRPYDGGDHDLFGLHRLSIIDKHQLLTVVVSLTYFDDFDLTKIDPSAPKMRTYNRIGAFDIENRDFLRWKPEPPIDTSVFKDGTKLPATFDILFGKGQPFTTTPVIKTLVKLTTKVEGIIRKFERIEP